MKPRGTLIQGALAFVGLGAAYATWQREPERAPGEVVVLDARKDDVTKVRFEDDKQWVEVTRGARDPGEEKPTIWIKVAAHEQGKDKIPERELRGNDQSARLLEGFAPLKAARALGAVEPGKLKEFGLAAPDAPARDGGAPATPPSWKKRTVTVTVRGQARVFTFGTPQGLYASYLKDEADGRVYLLSGTLMTDLENAGTRMVDRTIHGFKVADVDAITVEAAGKKRELAVTAGEAVNSVKLASKATPDKPDETAKNWHEKLFRAFPTDVLGKGEKPPTGEPQSVLKVAYAAHGASKGFLEIGKLMVTPPAPPPPPMRPPIAPGPNGPKNPKAAPPPTPPAPQPEYWGRSEHTAGWVKLGYGTDDLVKESEKIAASE
jgi:hypothetical protein